MKFIPYVYVIGWKSLDKWYIGCRYAEKCHPGDLWKTYFTSSEYVFNFRKQHGEPDSFEILKEFKTPKDALAYEEEKQREYNVLNDERWLNKNIGGKDFYCIGAWLGKHHSIESKLKISESLKGFKHTVEVRAKMSESRKGEGNGMWGKKGKDNPNFGRKQSAEFSKRMSEVHKGKIVSEETRKKMSESAKNRKHSEETKIKLKESWAKRKLLKQNSLI